MFTLSEALSAVKDKPEFSVNVREFGTVIDYNVAFPTTFKGSTDRETLILQNLRGTCFDHSGEIIRLCFHKFHNLNENPEYDAKHFDFAEPHSIEEKLDGSMIAPVPFPGGSWQLGTRGGVTEVAAKASYLLNDIWYTEKPQKYEAYKGLIDWCVKNGCTPMFEYCSRDQKIVLDYEEPMLVLTAIRHNESGVYQSINRIFINNPRIDIIRKVNMAGLSITELAAQVKSWLGKEGVVVKFDDGRFVKIKAEDYCLKHRALDGLRFEKDVLALVLSNGLDDVIPLVTPEVRDRLVKYQASVWKHITDVQQNILYMYETLLYKSKDKREFAENVKAAKVEFEHALFKMWDNKGKHYDLVAYMKTKCNSSTDVESIREWIGPSYYDF